MESLRGTLGADGAAGLARQARVLVIGTAGSAFLMLVTTVVAARALGSEDFGTLVVVQALLLTVDGLVNFQSWQALIHFGSGMDPERESDRFRRLIVSCARIDGATALAGTVIGVAAVALAATLLDWNDETTIVALGYCAVVLTNLKGVPTGLLRLDGRFDLLAGHLVGAAALRLAFVGMAAGTGAGFVGIATAWLAAEVLGQLALVAIGWWHVRARGFFATEHRRDPEGGTPRPDLGNLRRYLVTTNLHGTVKLGLRHLDVLVVGWVLGAAGAGVLRLAKQAATAAGTAIDPVSQVVYPTLGRLWHRGDRAAFGRLVVRAAVPCGAFGLLVLAGVAVVGRPAIDVLFGDAFDDLYAVLLWMLAGTTIAFAAVAVQPAMLAMGRPGTSLAVLTVTTAGYLGALWPMSRWLGVAGAAVAYLGFNVAWSAAMVPALTRAIRRSAPATGAARVDP